jgi:cystathionine beta-lyase
MRQGEIVLAVSFVAIVVAWARRRHGRFSFDSHTDRRGQYTVKHELAVALHGKKAAGALQLWVADMELPCCEFVRCAIARRAQHATFGYTFQPSEMWERAARWLVERQNWTHRPSSAAFVFSANVVASVCNVLRACTSEGQGIVLMTPSYGPLRHAIAGCRRKLILHPLKLCGAEPSQRQYGLALDVLEATLEAERPAALLLISPHNPSGRVWTSAELTALATACARHGVLVIADEIWGDWTLVHGGRTGAALGGEERFVPFASIASKCGCCHVTLGAPTKTFNLAGLHCSFVVIEDDDIRRQYLEYVEPATLHYGSVFATEAMLAAYEHGAPWLDMAVRYVTSNVAHLLDCLAKTPLAEYISAVRPRATYCVWLDCARLVTAVGLGEPGALESFMLDAGLVLSPGSEFDPSGASDCFMRINVACPRPMLEDALARLRDAMPR